MPSTDTILQLAKDMDAMHTRVLKVAAGISWRDLSKDVKDVAGYLADAKSDLLYLIEKHEEWERDAAQSDHDEDKADERRRESAETKRTR